MVHLIILTWISILPFVTSLTQKSALIKRIPPISSGSSTDFEIVCAFKILKEDALGARLVDGSTDCQTLNSDENIETSNTEAHLKYFRKTTSFETDGKTEVVKHFLEKNEYVYEDVRYEFFVQKIKDDGFSLTIRFENDKDDAVLGLSFDNDNCSISNQVNTTSSEYVPVDLPLADLKEYRLDVFFDRFNEILISWDEKWIFHYVLHFPFPLVETVVVATGPGAFYRSQTYNRRVY